MQHRTPADIVDQEQARLRSALRWALPAFGLGLLGIGIGFLGHGLESFILGLIGFGVGAAGVVLGAITVARTLWLILMSGLRKS